MSIETTRRSLLAAIPAVAAVATIPAAALATAPVADRRAWEHAMALYQRAVAEEEAFEPEWARIYDAWKVGRPSFDMIDWRKLRLGDPLCGLDRLHREHTARNVDLDRAYQNHVASHRRTWWSKDPEKNMREYRAALDTVQAFRDAEARHDRDSGMDAASERYDVLADAHTDALEVVMNTPAPDLAALRWKLDYLTDNGRGEMAAWSAEFVRQTFEDIRRVMPEGR